MTPAVFGMLPAHEAMPLARAAHRKALEIDPMLPEALCGLASVAMLYDFDCEEAGRLFEMARARGPLPGGARARYGHYLFWSFRDLCGPVGPPARTAMGWAVCSAALR